MKSEYCIVDSESVQTPNSSDSLPPLLYRSRSGLRHHNKSTRASPRAKSRQQRRLPIFLSLSSFHYRRGGVGVFGSAVSVAKFRTDFRFLHLNFRLGGFDTRPCDFRFSTLFTIWFSVTIFRFCLVTRLIPRPLNQPLNQHIHDIIFFIYFAAKSHPNLVLFLARDQKKVALDITVFLSLGNYCFACRPFKLRLRVHENPYLTPKRYEAAPPVSFIWEYTPTGIEFGHFDLMQRVFFPLASHHGPIGYFVYKELLFFHMKLFIFVVFLKCLHKWSCDHDQCHALILEVWDRFLPQVSEIGYGKSLILA